MLFTNTSIHHMSAVMKDTPSNDTTLGKGTKVFILEITYFTLASVIYQQTFGVVKGSLMSLVVVDLVMENLQDKIPAMTLLQSSQYTSKTRCYKIIYSV